MNGRDIAGWTIVSTNLFELGIVGKLKFRRSILKRSERGLFRDLV